MQKSIDSAILLTIGTAILYALGSAEYGGFTNQLSLNEDIMERSFHQTIYSGFLFSWVYIELVLLVIVFCLYVYSHGLLQIYVDHLRKGFAQKKRIVKMRDKFFKKRNYPAIEIRERARLNFFAKLFLGFTVLIFFLTAAERSGVAEAKSILSLHIDNRNSDLLIETEINGSVKELIFLGCGVRNCAGYDQSSKKTHYFQESNGYSFKSQYKEVASNDELSK